MKKSKNNGITLVALIVTIIILLILAGVAISALTQTGLFENAKQAKNAMENAQNAEDETLSNYENKINTIVAGNREEITIDKEEYETLKKNCEYEKYEKLEDIIELNSNIKSLEGEVKRQGKNSKYAATCHNCINSKSRDLDRSRKIKK